MREILFRGKRKDNGEWIEGSLVVSMDQRYIGTIDRCAIPVIPETVGQFTGLTDKYGKKIFEGDVIVNVLYGIFLPKDRKVVEWSDGSCGFEPYSDSIENCGHCGGGLNPDWTEVIGNIHDNPELLEEQENG